MKRINDSKITSYETGHDDFIMDIVETSAGFGQPMFELWLYRAMTGYKKYIVGEYRDGYYADMSVYQYARTCIQYLRTVGTTGLNQYDLYDQDIEDFEIASMNRIR